MNYKYLLLFIIPVLLLSCKKEKEVTTAQPQDPPVNPGAAVLLKDIVIPHLPSPYYHFEYNTAGKPDFASFASGYFMYDIVYSGGRISEMRNNIIVNKDRLKYTYNDNGNVSSIEYIRADGLVFRRIFFTYNEQKLIKAEREVKSGAGFIVEKTMTFSYHADGNLLEITQHRPAIPIAGQTETTYSDRYEQYDAGINTEGFSLMHDEFFDHLVLLPEVQLQKNNPGKLTHTGDGINYKVDYTYSIMKRMRR